jgi:subtilisin family serine protease
VNISASFAQPSIRGERAIQDALDHAARRGVIVVAAAGNHSGSTAITRHPWVIPVVAYDTRGRPMDDSNLAGSIARRGLGAPGEKITSLGVGRVSMTFSGTSAAAPFVSGAVALLRSVFPGAASGDVKHALTRAHAPRRSTIVPPMLNASLAYHALREGERRG